MSDPRLRIGRRAFLAALGAGAGWAVARGLGVGGRGGAPESASVEAPLRALAASLTPFQRARIVLPADHPSRQINNTVAFLDRPHLGTLLSPAQRALVGEIYTAMLSPRGREAFAGTIAVEGRLDGCVLAIYGEPESGPAQVAILGGHLLLRGGAPLGEAAFGGGVAYGHQVGNGRWRVPGNSFAHHGDAANRVYAALGEAERAAAIVPVPPHELVLQVQDPGGRFPGVRGAALSEPARDAFERLLETVFASYPEPRRRAAFACIEHNGGIDALHFAVYETHGFYEEMVAWRTLDPAERVRRGDPYWQVWRVEGPGTVIHFKGHPHVHAYVDVVRDPARARVGETLAETDVGIEGEQMRRLLEAALRGTTGEALAFHGSEIPGRFCPGAITTGLAYALDPYGNRVVVARIEGRAMAPPLRLRLAQSGVRITPHERYDVATTDHAARQRDEFGEPFSIEAGPTLLRDALVAQLRGDGLSAIAG